MRLIVRLEKVVEDGDHLLNSGMRSVVGEPLRQSTDLREGVFFSGFPDVHGGYLINLMIDNFYILIINS